MGTFRNDAICVAFFSNSLRLKGSFICKIGISFFSFKHMYMHCFDSSKLNLFSIFINSRNKAFSLFFSQTLRALCLHKAFIS